MATKIVDVFLKDERVASYELTWDIVNAPLFDQDFVDRTRVRMREDGTPTSKLARLDPTRSRILE